MLMASTAIFPTPSHMKMDSTMAVPPSSEPMERVSSVIIVTRDAFMTLFIMVVEKGTPRALAPRT